MRNDTTQINIINQFILFIEIDRGKPLSGAEKQDMEEGMCLGFAITYGYMRAVQKKDWWGGVLEAIAAWDGQKNSLTKKVKIVGETERQTLYLLIYRAVSYILFNQANLNSLQDRYQVLGENKFIETNFLAINGPFVSDLGKIINRATVSGYFTDDLLKMIIQEKYFSQNAIFLLTVAGTNYLHACSFYYSIARKKWVFYDPNKTSDYGYTTKADFIKFITESYGRSLSIEVATWNQEAAAIITEFSQHCIELIKKSSLKSLMQKYGLYLIVFKNNGDTALRIIREARTDQETYNAFCDALVSGYETSHSALNRIVNYEAGFLPIIFSTMVNGETGPSRNRLTRIFSKKIEKTLGDFLYQIIKNSKDSIPLIIALSQKHKNFLITLSRYLNFEGSRNWTTLLIMFYHSKDFAKEIVLLANKKNIYFYMALMEFFTLSTDYPENKGLITYFNQILFWMINSDTLFGEIIQKSDSVDTLAQKIINTFSLLDKYSETEVKAYLNKILLASNNPLLLKAIINHPLCNIKIQGDILPKIIHKIIDIIPENSVKKIFLLSQDIKVLQIIFAHSRCSNMMLKDFFNRTDIEYSILSVKSKDRPKNDNFRIEFIYALIRYISSDLRIDPSRSASAELRFAAAEKLILALRFLPHAPFTHKEKKAIEDASTNLGTICEKFLEVLVKHVPITALATPEKENPRKLNGALFRQPQFSDPTPPASQTCQNRTFDSSQRLFGRPRPINPLIIEPSSPGRTENLA